MPTVIWDTPLSNYLDMPLAKLRRLKTHGDKRVRNILEAFFHIHQVLKAAATPRHLVVQLRPAFVIPIEQWMHEVMRRETPPALQELRQSLILPLLNQIEADSDETIGRLLAGRLGIESPPESAIEQAEKLNVTRARIYQLLDHAGHAMRVRWPEGGWQLMALDGRLSADAAGEGQQMLRSLRAALYPERSRGDATKAEAMTVTRV
jgi:hypothetical protein